MRRTLPFCIGPTASSSHSAWKGSGQGVFEAKSSRQFPVKTLQDGREQPVTASVRPATIPEIIKSNPYGVSDLANLRSRGGFFVDRTECIHALEELPYQLFLRPRRFGKSLLVSILHYYYDVLAAERFDEHLDPRAPHGEAEAFQNADARQTFVKKLQELMASPPPEAAKPVPPAPAELLQTSNPGGSASMPSNVPMARRNTSASALRLRRRARSCSTANRSPAFPRRSSTSWANYANWGWSPWSRIP